MPCSKDDRLHTNANADRVTALENKALRPLVAAIRPIVDGRRQSQLPISRISPLGSLRAHLMSLHVVKLNDKLLNVKAATAPTMADAFVISLLLPAVFSKK